MDDRYNVYFAGQLLDGWQLADVRENLGKLFNADQHTLDKLFSGKTQLLKRDCDKATALKYKQAMERAGASPLVRSSQDSATPASQARAQHTSPAPGSDAAEPPPSTAAQKIAALAAAPDETMFRGGEQESQQTATSPDAGPAEPPAPGQPGIAPPGAVILQAHERSPQITADIDVSGLAVDAPVDRLAPLSPAPPPAPDTSHLNMGEIGEAIPGLVRQPPPEPPDTSDLGLTEGELDLSEFAAPAAPPPVLDNSDMQLAPVGADVLEEHERRRDDTPAPATEHISLQE